MKVEGHFFKGGEMNFRAVILGFCWMILFTSSAWGQGRAVLTTTDYASGSIAVVDLETNQASANVLNIHSDAVIRSYAGHLYVINRFNADNILVLDPDDLATPVRQFSVGNGTNPQDIAFVSETKAYVARYGSDRLLVVNPATGDSLGSVDLSFAADADGLPEVAFLTIFKGRLYATCQRLYQFAPTDRSEVVVVDVDTDTSVDLDQEQDGIQGIVLQARNPAGGQVRVGPKLYLSCAGSFGDLSDGGIEVVNLEENVTEGVVLDGDALGGNAGAIALTSEGGGYVVVSDASFVDHVKRFDLAAGGTIAGTLPGGSGGFVPEIAAWNGNLYVLDQGPEAAGLLVYDVTSETLVAGPISTGLPPSSIAFLKPPSAADFNGDEAVNFVDFISFVLAFDTAPGDADWDARFDLDGDLEVGFSDFLIFARLFGT